MDEKNMDKRDGGYFGPHNNRCVVNRDRKGWHRIKQEIKEIINGYRKKGGRDKNPPLGVRC
jgi:hypothetical protein